MQASVTTTGPPTPLTLEADPITASTPFPEEGPRPRRGAGGGQGRSPTACGRSRAQPVRGRGPRRAGSALRSRPGFAAAAPSVPPPCLFSSAPRSLPPLPRLDQSSGISCSRAASPAEPPRARPGPARPGPARPASHGRSAAGGEGAAGLRRRRGAGGEGAGGAAARRVGSVQPAAGWGGGGGLRGRGSPPCQSLRTRGKVAGPEEPGVARDDRGRGRLGGRMVLNVRRGG